MSYTEKKKSLLTSLKVRCLKLHPFHRKLRYGHYSIVPELRLNGRWLEEAGFKVEDYVSVTVKNKKLIIQLKKDEDISFR